jgi:hypothetical protein
MQNILAAQTQNLYVCSGSCGSPGPFPDYPQSQPPTGVNVNLQGNVQLKGNVTIQ